MRSRTSILLAAALAGADFHRIEEEPRPRTHFIPAWQIGKREVVRQMKRAQQAPSQPAQLSQRERQRRNREKREARARDEKP